MAVAIVLVGRDRPVRAFSRAVGKCVADEARLENGAIHRAECVMHNAVAEWRGRDESFLRVEYLDDSVTAGPIAAVQSCRSSVKTSRSRLAKKQAAPDSGACL